MELSLSELNGSRPAWGYRCGGRTLDGAGTNKSEESSMVHLSLPNLEYPHISGGTRQHYSQVQD